MSTKCTPFEKNNGELLIRQLEWQNGLYRGMLTVMLPLLLSELSSEDSKDIRDTIEKTLQAPLPEHLQVHVKFDLDVAIQDAEKKNFSMNEGEGPADMSGPVGHKN